MNVTGLIRKEFGRIKSDKRTLVLLFFIPFILILIFGLTTGGGTTKFFNAAVISKDQIRCKGYSSNSHEHDDTFIRIMRENCSSFGLYQSNITIDELEYAIVYEQCMQLLKNDIIDVFIVLPENFSEAINAGEENLTLYYHVDGSDVMAVSAVEVALQEPIALFRLEIGLMENFVIGIPYMEYFPIFHWKI